MKLGEKYWTYAQPPIPELSDLPPGTFNGDERAWESLSPGLRRTIWREATRRCEPEQTAVSVDAEKLRRADALHHQSQVQIAAREAL